MYISTSKEKYEQLLKMRFFIKFCLLFSVLLISWYHLDIQYYELRHYVKTNNVYDVGCPNIGPATQKKLVIFQSVLSSYARASFNGPFPN